MSDEEVIAEIEEKGIPLAHYFLLGEGHKLVGFWTPLNGVMAYLIEQQAVQLDYIRTLRNLKVREFRIASDAFEVARREGWPNWEDFAESYSRPTTEGKTD